ncbi:hypothetical protein BC828DRAFT_345516 [Blastocladiella britannica]|nr:hypothetical protein BC828DRAFT_345516 [Blastocladiella britannica]
MHLTQHDPAFTEELRAIEEWFKVLSEIERTAAMYALFQYMTPVQIRYRYFILIWGMGGISCSRLPIPIFGDRTNKNS